MSEPNISTLSQELKLNAVMPLIVNYISDCFIALDDEGHILFANEKLLTVLGYTVKEFKYKKFLDYLDHNDLQRTIEAFEKSKTTGSLGEFINSYKHKEGHYIRIKWRQSFSLHGLTFGLAEPA